MYRLLTALWFVGLAPWTIATPTFELTLTVTDLTTGAPVEGATVVLENSQPAPPVNAEIIQKYRQFQPGSIVVPIGSSVAFPNRDVTQHHVYSFSPAKVFDIELYAGEPESPVIFDKTGVVELGCNIHDQMQAFILVTDSAVTDSTNSQGEARLTLPASVLQSTDMALQIWHPHLRNSTTPAVFQIARPTTLPLTLSVDLLPQVPATSRLERLQKRFQDLE